MGTVWLLVLYVHGLMGVNREASGLDNLFVFYVMSFIKYMYIPCISLRHSPVNCVYYYYIPISHMAPLVNKE